MKTQHCDQCKHATMRALPKPTLICAMLHKPRFYAPVYWLKDSWGWKRKCEDFLEKTHDLVDVPDRHCSHCRVCVGYLEK